MPLVLTVGGPSAAPLSYPHRFGEEGVWVSSCVGGCL